MNNNEVNRNDFQHSENMKNFDEENPEIYAKGKLNFF